MALRAGATSLQEELGEAQPPQKLISSLVSRRSPQTREEMINARGSAPRHLRLCISPAWPCRADAKSGSVEGFALHEPLSPLVWRRSRQTRGEREVSLLACGPRTPACGTLQ